MTRAVPIGERRALGDRALLIGVADPSAGRVLAGALRRHLADTGTATAEVDVVVGAATVLVSVLDPAAELEPVRAAVTRAQAEGGAGDTGAPARPGRLVTIPCVFDGPDLDEVARLTGLSPDAVVAHLTAGSLSVEVMGFSPGFAYLEGLPEPLRPVPRRDRPRPLVAAGTVALANGYAAVYPTASPGGWQLVGHTGLPLFLPHEAPYAVLAPGDRVHLTVAGPGEAATPPPLARPAWDPPPHGRAVFEVVAPGLRAALQDGGRPGVAAAGVPWAGPADPVSLTLANRLVGNEDDAAAIEVTAGGLKLCGLSPCHVAVVGGAPDVRVGGHPVASGRVTPVPDGALLEIGPFRRGCRTYVAVAGGFLGPRLFGSVATDELSDLGPGALAMGRRLYAGPWSPPLGDHVADDASAPAGDPPEVVELRVVAVPHTEVFAPDALARLAECAFVVDGSSNRVGIRLLGDPGAPVPVPHIESGGRLDSHGVVTGVVQVPPGGQPVVLGPDHATLGGYPVLAVVAAADHGRLGQCGPGTRVRLVPVDPDEAEAARRAQRRALDHAVVGHYPLAAG
jgi:KipI family sensor histidine kinase inhibitor